MVGIGFVRIWALGGAIFGLFACDPLPKPFQARPDLGPPELTARNSSGGIQVAIVGDSSAPMAKLLSEVVAADLVNRGIPAATKDVHAFPYTLTGRVEERRKGAGGPVAKVHWSLNERGGEPFFTFTQDVQGTEFDWQWGSPKVIQSVGANAARVIAEAVEPEDKTLKPAQAVSRGVWVQPVKGAPGDGDVSLTRAMRYALMGAKVSVTSERLAARHVLKADVRVDAAQDGKQSVVIRWTVIHPDGRHAGNAVQRNVVPAGTFDGRWGEMAAIIAAAAVGGIRDVLDQAENTARSRTAPEPGLKTDVIRGKDRPELPPPHLSPEAG